MAAFAERVTRHFPLDGEELQFLEELEASPVPVKRGQVLAEEGASATHAFVLLSGWVMSSTRFPDGSHQVRRLHFPGDLLAMPSVPMRHYAEDIEALSDALVAPFAKQVLARLFAMPRLAAIMYMFAQAERITAGDRLASLGHNSAKGRIAFLLMDILHRLRSSDRSVASSFVMHLTREQVAQVTGMTSVHASRMWCALVTDGLIRCNRRLITIVDEQALCDLGHYTDRDTGFDYAWLKRVKQLDPLLTSSR